MRKTDRRRDQNRKMLTMLGIFMFFLILSWKKQLPLDFVAGNRKWFPKASLPFKTSCERWSSSHMAELTSGRCPHMKQQWWTEASSNQLPVIFTNAFLCEINVNGCWTLFLFCCILLGLNTLHTFKRHGCYRYHYYDNDNQCGQDSLMKLLLSSSAVACFLPPEIRKSMHCEWHFEDKIPQALHVLSLFSAFFFSSYHVFT